ncbi:MULTISPECIES: alpha/beta hydrolase [unclassified Undibacterium]|uniref:alpha/beta fold hydrolase n=1 Tax=unclassified Undibacterium TaxID=2630295 RepID=UPI002AC9B4F5|nr:MULTISPECIES: alpha/beta hydrolase [unclassified Undibacterium]MEB0139152.1 alpha/beta hydrolase [Undibacterium sp. CCC2.1]MEB0172868.1 alpha/beta hydrolase [Undibacterium sp. CCC1.1]MEB0176660.1 alpha/beta hydrolase [Undibacterium sp. CCC3.4]MEB0216012.1 alpha/beta hydrolase [Undibacterium sp. 5I2]WPX43146.1 alpha/beta hydrolase [Undibacterium sp. CCC3.4]
MMYTVQHQQAYCYSGGKAINPALASVVFLHGAQNDHSVWALQSRYLAHHGYNVLALDLPAHGRSGGSALTSVEQMADWVLAVLDAAGVEQAALIGHSMGSLIALEVCARAPQRVTHLGLLGSAWPMKVSDSLLNAARDEVQSAIDMVNIWSHSAMTHKPSCPGPGFSILGGSRRLMQKIAAGSSEAIFHIDFSACNAYANGAAAAHSVRCPTLLLSGKKDQMTPPKAAALLHQQIAHSRFVLLDQCGHALMAEQADQVLDALRAFLQE